MNAVVCRCTSRFSFRLFVFWLIAVLGSLGCGSPGWLMAETLAQKEKNLAAAYHSSHPLISHAINTGSAGKKTRTDASGTQTYEYEGGQTEDDESFAVGPDGATVNITWQMYMIPDRLELVVPGSNALPGIPNVPFDFFATGSVQYEGSQSIYIPAGIPSFQIIMNRGGGEPDTAWVYDVTISQGFTGDLTGVGGNPNQLKYDPFDFLHHNLVFDPVDTSTGAHVIRKSLLTLGGARPLTFEIDYNSLLGYNGPLGTGWSHNHQVSLLGLSNGNILVRWNNKRQNIFKLARGQSNRFVSNDLEVLFYTLTQNGDGSLTLKSKDQSIWNFDSAGRMTSQVNAIGQTINYTYDGTGTVPITITEPVSGHSFSLTYDGQNLLQQVSDNTGRKVTFAYSADLTDRLVGITLAEGDTSQTYSYTYDNNGRVLTGTTPEGVTVFQDSYDSKQRIASQTDANGKTSYFSYDETSHPGYVITKVKNRLEAESVYVSNAYYLPTSATDPYGNVTSYGYDANGQRTSAIDADGHITQFVYDPNGNMTMVTDPGGYKTFTTYDALNRPTTITNAAGGKKTITYDTLNRPLTISDFEGNKTTFAYDSNSLLTDKILPRGGKQKYIYAAGQLTQSRNPDNGLTRFTYDSKGRVSTITDPFGGVITLGYDINDNVVSRTDPLGNTAYSTYDSHNHKLSETDALGSATYFAYDGNQNLIAGQDALGNETDYTYDAEDHLSSVTDANENTTFFFYNAAGRLSNKVDPLGNTTGYTYDKAGNRTVVNDPLHKNVANIVYGLRNLPISVSDALGHETKNIFNSLGQLQSKSDPLNRITKYSYDLNGSLTAVTNPLHQTTSQSFDADGNLASLTDANGNTTNLDNDPAGRLVGVTTPTGITTGYSYGPRGFLVKIYKPSGQEVDSTFDAAGRKTILVDGTGTTNYTYDAVGHVLTVARDNSPITRTYDAAGHVTKFTDYFGHTISYAYDAVGNQTAITYPNGKTVQYTYDAVNRMTSVTDWTGHRTIYTYDAAGHLDTTLRADGSIETRTYDAAGELTGLYDSINGRRIYRSIRTFDAAGQLISEVTKPKVKPVPFGKEKFRYDADNRLTAFDSIATSFDADSNMTLGPLGGASQARLKYNGRDQLSAAGGLSYSYDAENVRTAVSDGTSLVGYVYDRSVPLTRLLEKVEPQGKVTNYIYGLGLISDDADGGYRVYHFDARGDTVALTDQSGNTLGKATYGVFGEIVKQTGATTDTPFLFNGRYGVMTDANGLYYMRNRYYDPTIRRFINQDPLLGSLTDGGGLNRFAFANGNPVSLTDPFGLAADEDENLRFPDFYSININLEIPGFGLVGPAFGVTVDRYGNVYPSGGGGFGIPGVSATVGYITQASIPSEEGLTGFLSGLTVNGGGGFIIGGTLIYSPNHDTSTESTAISFGLFTPQFGASGTYTPSDFIIDTSGVNMAPSYTSPIRLP